MAFEKFFETLLALTLAYNIGAVESACDDVTVTKCLGPLARYKDELSNIHTLNYSSTFLSEICTLRTKVNKCLEPLQCGSGSSLSITLTYYKGWLAYDPLLEFFCSKGILLFQGDHPCLPNSLVSDNVTSCVASYLFGLQQSNGTRCSILEPGIDRCIYNSSAVCGSTSAKLMVDLLRQFRRAQAIETTCTPAKDDPEPGSYAVVSVPMILVIFLSTLLAWICIR